MGSGSATYEIEDLLRELAPQVLGVLVRRYGDFATAEDALQEALLAAATQWPSEGTPDNPRGWLIQVAARRLVDTVRAEVARRNRETATMQREVPATAELSDAMDERDDTLTLFFLCCHPVLSPASAIALTLRAVGGLSTEEIARAFLLPESTMAQRISRAKQRLAAVDRPFASDEAAADESGCPGAWRERVGTVLQVLYLIFTEGHTTGGSQLRRNDLSAEAIRLARALHRLLPEDSEVTGLLALLLLTDSRRAARSGPHGELIPLAEQDRGKWQRGSITEGIRLVTATLPGGLAGPYQIQAAIAALHSQASRAEDTEWDRILLLYNRLERLTPNPVVRLNRAVALAMVEGPQAGLDLVATVEDALRGSHRLEAVRGHFYEMAGDFKSAIASYSAAARRTTSTPERDYLMLRAALLRNSL
ncbi:sigma-70 family RNA polymerase sigma factor [Nocardia sp. NBC_01503]|uniref:RNA polymerase sigma factor n=1 Tax=Nocardia sp. NBC_01503 TaxID=2975997 RepID=UPI002E7BCCE1|nr:sigma-70 family RNA polymerase sigma factor [Nocardia sp. NBC_01503]WTL33233.1 sigma-70 family RNA polymerase sigma factor [Nocardia sp. NBC_01503]